MKLRKVILMAIVVAGVKFAMQRAKQRPPTAQSDVQDIVEEWGEESFPASDPPAHW